MQLNLIILVHRNLPNWCVFRDSNTNYEGISLKASGGPLVSRRPPIVHRAVSGDAHRPLQRGMSLAGSSVICATYWDHLVALGFHFSRISWSLQQPKHSNLSLIHVLAFLSFIHGEISLRLITAFVKSQIRWESRSSTHLH